MEHVNGVCRTCHSPLHPTNPCACHGDYKVGDIFSRKAHECEVMSKHFNIDFNGIANGCVYLVKIREYGKINVDYIVGYDGHFNGYIWEGNVYE